HLVSAKRNLHSDRHSFAELEVRDAGAGFRDHRFLTRNQTDIADGFVQGGLIERRVDTAVDHDLLDRGNLVRVFISPAFLQSGNNLFGVEFLKCWHWMYLFVGFPTRLLKKI